MTPFLMLALSFVGVTNFDVPPRYWFLLKLPPPPAKIKDDFYRQHLARCRSVINGLEAAIEWIEKEIARDGPIRYTAEGVKQLRAEIAEWREHLVKYKQEEKQLLAWEEERKRNPGQETYSDAIGKLIDLHYQLWPKYPTAPMPREAKP